MLQSLLNRFGWGAHRIVQQLVGLVMVRSENFHLQLVSSCGCNASHQTDLEHRPAMATGQA